MTPQVAAALATHDRADPSWSLEAGLAAAARGRGMMFVALPAPIVPITAVLAAWPASSPAVAWSQRRARARRARRRVRAARLRRCALDGAGDGGRAARRGSRDRRRRGGADVGARLRAAAVRRWRGVRAGDRRSRPVDRLRRRVVRAAAVDVCASTGAARVARARGRCRARRATARALERRARDAARGARRAGARRSSQPPMRDIERGDAPTWRTQVTDITDAIARGACSKIVAARTCVVTLDGDARPADLLAALDERHAECARVLVRPPGAGALVAATPERLVRREGAEVACDALAGTIARTGDAETRRARRHQRRFRRERYARAARIAASTISSCARSRMRSPRPARRS